MIKSDANLCPNSVTSSKSPLASRGSCVFLVTLRLYIIDRLHVGQYRFLGIWHIWCWTDRASAWSLSARGKGSSSTCSLPASEPKWSSPAATSIAGASTGATSSAGNAKVSFIWNVSLKMGTLSLTLDAEWTFVEPYDNWIPSTSWQKNGSWSGNRTKGFPVDTIFPKNRTIGKSSITLKLAWPKVDPFKETHASAVYDPFPVSNLIGEIDWVQLWTTVPGTPCSMNARFDARSRPAPESAIHSKTMRSCDFDCAIHACGSWYNTAGAPEHCNDDHSLCGVAISKPPTAESVNPCGWTQLERSAKKGRTIAQMEDFKMCMHVDDSRITFGWRDDARDTPPAAARTATVAFAFASAAALGFAAGLALGSWRNRQLSPLLHVPFGQKRHGAVALPPSLGSAFGFAWASFLASEPLPFPLHFGSDLWSSLDHVDSVRLQLLHPA